VFSMLFRYVMVSGFEAEENDKMLPIVKWVITHRPQNQNL